MELLNGDWGFRKKNEAREKILEFAKAYGLGIVNTFLKKIDEYIIT